MANLYEQTRELDAGKQLFSELPRDFRWPRSWSEWPSVWSLTALVLKLNVAVLLVGLILSIPALIVVMIYAALIRVIFK